MTTTPDKLKLHSPDLTQQNIARVAEMFPNCVTESKDEVGSIKQAIDFDQLRQELSDHVVDGPRERYHLNWPGKREALLAANAPIAKTLRPCRKESVDFDTTKNLFIEGDNLDALKLLQETYLNKVKMIYIDPPYNTGKEFVYDDDYSEDIASFLLRSNQAGPDGQRLVANPESNGRFHSAWLTMIYPRLKLAKNLLSNDGILAISIDDNEHANLRKACNEVFGEHNFVCSIAVVSNPRGRQSDTHVASVHDYLVVYAKSSIAAVVGGAPLTAEQKSDFKFSDDNGPYRLLGLRQRGAASRREDRPDMFFPIYVRRADAAIRLDKPGEPGWEAVYPRKSDGSDGRWGWGKQKVEKDSALLVARLIDSRDEFDIFVKDYLRREGQERTRKFKTLWDGKHVNNQAGTQEVKALLEHDVMSYPKASGLLGDIVRLACPGDGIVLDFFAGSATTAHAVMAVNADDGAKRRYVMVQLPESCSQDSKAWEVGYRTVADISKERIRRAGTTIKEEAGLNADKLDIGFRVLKIDSSNMKDVYYAPDAVEQKDLLGHAENLKEDRTDEDLLFQVLLDWGVDLSLPIKPETIAGKTVYFVDENALAACFETGIDEEFVKKLAERKPLRVVFRDAGYGTDSTKVNVEQIFKLISPTTEVKTL